VIGRAAAGLLLALLLVPLDGGVAWAHGSPGAEADLPRVLAVEPAVPGLAVTVVEGGARLRLDNRTGADVDVRPPAGAARDREPVVPAGASAAWADARMSDQDGWTIPLVAGGLPVTVHGDRVRPAAPEPVPWWSGTVFAAAATCCVGAIAVERGRRSRATAAVAGLTALVVGAHVLHVLGSALVLAAPPSLATVLAAAEAGVACWVLGVGGVALTLARRELGLLTCATAGALTALVTVFDTAGFHQPVLAFAWAFDVDRLTTVITVGGGIGLFLTGCAAMHRTGSGRPVATVSGT
jgi:hypothetical protein